MHCDWLDHFVLRNANERTSNETDDYWSGFFLGGSHIDWEGISDDRYNY